MKRIPITVVIEDEIDENMILSSLSTMVGVHIVEIHRKGIRWNNGSTEQKEKHNVIRRTTKTTT